MPGPIVGSVTTDERRTRNRVIPEEALAVFRELSGRSNGAGATAVNEPKKNLGPAAHRTEHATLRRAESRQANPPTVATTSAASVAACG